MYRNWAHYLPPDVQVIPVELPGRGTRLKEPPIVNLVTLIDVLAEVVFPLLDAPFAFFGHSMGSIIAFEMARRLRGQYGREPETLFVSGRRAPQAADRSPVTYNLPTNEFINELHKLDGTPKEVLENAELMELMLPLLRADFQLVQTYEYCPDIPLKSPIIAYGGLQDSEEIRDLLSLWGEQTSSSFRLHMLPGDHFFLRSSQDLLLRLLARELHEITACLRTCYVRH